MVDANLDILYLYVTNRIMNMIIISLWNPYNRSSPPIVIISENKSYTPRYIRYKVTHLLRRKFPYPI